MCASAAWALWLAAFGGFDRTVGGIRIRSNNPQRVLALTVVATVTYVLAGGRIRLAPVVSPIVVLSTTLLRKPAWMAAALAAAATIVAVVNSTRIAGGADAYGYISQAELWLDGDLKVEQPWVAETPWPDRAWTFAPLGFRPADGEWSIVPTYSPGLPILMAAAKFVAGHCAMFTVVPLSLGAAVLIVYGLGRRLGSPLAGAVAAWFVATSPVVLEVSVESLTDVPVMAAWSLAFYFVLAPTLSGAIGGGLCASLAVLIRPNLVPLIVPMIAWLWIGAVAGSWELRRQVGRVGAFLVGVLPGIAAVALINQYLYGSPLTSGYGSLAGAFASAHVLPNLRRFISWIVETQTPLALLGLAAIAVPLRSIWPGVHDRRVFAAIAVFVGLLWAQYSAYLEFDSAGYLRFLLPSWPFMMLGLASILLSVGRVNGPVLRWVVASVIVALGVWNLHVAVRRDVFEQRQAARHEAPIGRLVRAHTASNSVILSEHRSGSLRYYAGRVTARYDLLDPQWLDRFVAWFTERGVHVYAVLDDREAAESRQRFVGQRLTAALERPVLIYTPTATALFDLSSPPEKSRPATVVSEAPPRGDGCDPPVRKPSALRVSPAFRSNPLPSGL